MLVSMCFNSLSILFTTTLPRSWTQKKKKTKRIRLRNFGKQTLREMTTQNDETYLNLYQNKNGLCIKKN